MSDVFKDLMDLIGDTGEGEDLTSDDVQRILQAGVGKALRAQLDVMGSSQNDKTKAFVAKDWLDRAGYKPVDKVAVQQRIAFDPETLKVLALIAAEADDQDSGIRTLPGAVVSNGPGGDPGIIEATFTELPLLSEQSGTGTQGPDGASPQETGGGDSGSINSSEGSGVAPGASEDNAGDDHKANS